MKNARLSGFVSKGAPAVILAAAVLLGTLSVATADHQWGSYHWERPDSDPLALNVGDNHDVYDVYGNGSYLADWRAIFQDVIAHWGPTPAGYGGAYLSVGRVAGSDGDIKSYNDNYGNTGWLGLASIWVTRGKNKHIARGESKVNEYYIADYDPSYIWFDEPHEWQHVMCQEIGHTLGLDHIIAETCMNTAKPLLNPTPNDHDTETLHSASMYGHDHGDGGDGGGKKPKCNRKFSCAGAAHAVWAEQYADEEEMFDAADLVVSATVLSSGFDGMVGRGAGAVPITRVVLRVTETLKGWSRRPVIVLEQTRGPGLEVEDDPGYVTGDDYGLYLREIGANTYRIVNPDGRIRQ
jgi:hypothetical protein